MNPGRSLPSERVKGCSSFWLAWCGAVRLPLLVPLALGTKVTLIVSC